MAFSTPLLSSYLDYPRFKAPPYGVILLESGYLAVDECRRGLEKLGHRVWSIKLGDDFIARLLRLLVEARPDFILTVNHLGFDEEGKLTNLLTDLKLPFATWYVDSPSYILKGRDENVSEYCAVFSWERNYLQGIAEMGFDSPLFLPLATDPELFRPMPVDGRSCFISDLSFVGNSMLDATRKWERKLPEGFMERIAPAAVEAQIKNRRRPMGDILAELSVEADNEAGRLEAEAALVWKATQEYRLRLARSLAPLGLVIYGDNGWRSCLAGYKGIRQPVHYSRELPLVYNGTAVNMNATSFQMNSAVNQRVFDVAASGGFLLTDRQGDMERFFEPGTEAVCYESPEEAASLAAHYLKNATGRRKVAERARRRVLAEHTYEKRMETLVAHMRQKFT